MNAAFARAFPAIVAIASFGVVTGIGVVARWPGWWLSLCAVTIVGVVVLEWLWWFRPVDRAWLRWAGVGGSLLLAAGFLGVCLHSAYERVAMMDSRDEIIAQSPAQLCAELRAVSHCSVDSVGISSLTTDRAIVVAALSTDGGACTVQALLYRDRNRWKVGDIGVIA